MTKKELILNILVDFAPDTYSERAGRTIQQVLISDPLKRHVASAEDVEMFAGHMYDVLGIYLTEDEIREYTDRGATVEEFIKGMRGRR
jgi:hypothetical protein